MKMYFYDGFFDNANLSPQEIATIIGGYSPVRKKQNGEEITIFTIHHKKPLICSGETITSNLIPLPRNFHDFLHEKVIDPQLKHIKVGEKGVLVAMPDFSKITLPMMMDSGFVLQYHKFIVDEYHMLPEEFKTGKKKNDKQFIANWYLSTFGPHRK